MVKVHTVEKFSSILIFIFIKASFCRFSYLYFIKLAYFDSCLEKYMPNEKFRNYPPELESEFTLFCLQHWCYFEKKHLPYVFAKVLFAYYCRTYEYQFPYTFFDYVTNNQKVLLDDFSSYANSPLFNLSINKHSKRKFSQNEIDKLCASEFATKNGLIHRMEKKLTLIRQKVEPINKATQQFWEGKQPYFDSMTPEEHKQFSVELDAISFEANQILNKVPLDIFVSENFIPSDTRTFNTPLCEWEDNYLERIKFNKVMLMSEKFRSHKENIISQLDKTTALLLDSFGNIELWIQPIKSKKESYLFIKSTNSSDAAIPLEWFIEESVPLFLLNERYDRYDHLPDDFITWDEIHWLEDIRHTHLYALEDFALSRIDFNELQKRIESVQKIPDGKNIPLSTSDWHYIENLNERLCNAQRFACENLSDEVDCFSLICWMREDDPDWFEDRDNWIYYNPSICTMEDYPNEDWNAFRSLTYDPLGDRNCGYFMHDLIDHGGLSSRDLLRIGKIMVSIQYHSREEVF